eukprot:scpid108131/ scgid16541/ 
MLRWLCKLKAFPAGQRYLPVLVGLGQFLFKASACAAETDETALSLQQEQSDLNVLAVVGVTAVINFILAILCCELRGRYLGHWPSLLIVGVGSAAASCISHDVATLQVYYFLLNCLIFAVWVYADAYNNIDAYINYQ